MFSGEFWSVWRGVRFSTLDRATSAHASYRSICSCVPPTLGAVGWLVSRTWCYQQNCGNSCYNPMLDEGAFRILLRTWTPHRLAVLKLTPLFTQSVSGPEQTVEARVICQWFLSTVTLSQTCSYCESELQVCHQTWVLFCFCTKTAVLFSLWEEKLEVKCVREDQHLSFWMCNSSAHPSAARHLHSVDNACRVYNCMFRKSKASTRKINIVKNIYVSNLVENYLKINNFPICQQ